MKEVIVKLDSGNLTIRLVYITQNIFKRYYVGKTYPKHTQCLVFKNNLFIGSGQVIKHYKDKDDPQYAYKLVTAKALKSITFKFIRKVVWDVVHKEIKHGTLKN